VGLPQTPQEDLTALYHTLWLMACRKKGRQRRRGREGERREGQ